MRRLRSSLLCERHISRAFRSFTLTESLEQAT